MLRLAAIILALLLLKMSGLAEADQTAIQTDEDVLCESDRWSVRRVANEARIFYQQGTEAPQYGAIHLNDSYFRLNYGPESGWGTSIILLPSFWTGGRYYQGAPITVTCEVQSPRLIFNIQGTIGTLDVTEKLTVWPPIRASIRARVSASVTGSVVLDNRSGEAFKPVMLSSMHVSNDEWDARLACVLENCSSIPRSRWIFTNPRVQIGSSFRLVGGTSDWKTNAPTVRINLGQNRPITGWITRSRNPNDDNIGFWASSSRVLRSWNYLIVVSRAR